VDWRMLFIRVLDGEIAGSVTRVSPSLLTFVRYFFGTSVDVNTPNCGDLKRSTEKELLFDRLRPTRRLE
jgi:hypothetical protein